MAENKSISKIELGGKTYDIKDAAAISQIATLVAQMLNVTRYEADTNPKLSLDRGLLTLKANDQQVWQESWKSFDDRLEATITSNPTSPVSALLAPEISYFTLTTKYNGNPVDLDSVPDGWFTATSKAIYDGKTDLLTLPDDWTYNWLTGEITIGGTGYYDATEYNKLYVFGDIINPDPVTTYTVTNILVNVTSTHAGGTVEAKQPFEATLTPAEGFRSMYAKCYMGGIEQPIDDNGYLYIGSVTADIIILASAEEIPETETETIYYPSTYTASPNVLKLSNVVYINPVDSGIIDLSTNGAFENGILTLTGRTYAPTSTYSVSNALSHITNSNKSVSVQSGSRYYAMLTADEGYAIKSVYCKMGSTEITVTNGIIDIANVTGNIQIVGIAEIYVETGHTYYRGTGILQLSDGATFTENVLDFGSTGSYDTETGIVVISGHTQGAASYTVAYSLGCYTSSNDATSVTENEAFTTTLTPLTGYTISSVVCKMGGVQQTVTNNVISIAHVTANIVITVVTEDVSLSRYVNGLGMLYLAEGCTMDHETGVLTSNGPFTRNDDGTLTLLGYAEDPKTYEIHYNLVNVSSSNNVTTLTEGGSYYSVLTANQGYTLGFATFSMGNVIYPITDGIINVDYVTSDIYINCTGVSVAAGDSIWDVNTSVLTLSADNQRDTAGALQLGTSASLDTDKNLIFQGYAKQDGTFLYDETTNSGILTFSTLETFDANKVLHLAAQDKDEDATGGGKIITLQAVQTADTAARRVAPELQLERIQMRQARETTRTPGTYYRLGIIHAESRVKTKCESGDVNCVYNQFVKTVPSVALEVCKPAYVITSTHEALVATEVVAAITKSNTVYIPDSDELDGDITITETEGNYVYYAVPVYQPLKVRQMALPVTNAAVEIPDMILVGVDLGDYIYYRTTEKIGSDSLTVQVERI